MSLDGLRAWIGEVERKLGMRTRVFLVLIAIAIGGAAGGIYLALEAASESVSKSEVQALQERLGTAAEEGGAGAEAATVAALKAEVETLRAQLSELQSEKGGSSSSGSVSPGGTSSGGGSSGSSSGGGSSGAEKAPPQGGTGTSPQDGTTESAHQKLKELFEKAR